MVFLTFALILIVVQSINPNVISLSEYCMKVSTKDFFDCTAMNFSGYEDISWNATTFSASTLRIADSNLYRIPNNTFSNIKPLESFVMTNCNLREIFDWHFYGGTSNPETKKISLAYNNLTAIPNGVFKYLDSLEELTPSWNNISTLERNAFVGLKSLVHLYLDNNRIEALHIDLFRPLRKLHTLIISSNKIKFLNNNIFAYNPELETLRINNNKLTIIDLTHYDFYSVHPITNLAAFASPNITELDISGNFMPYIGSDFILKIPNLRLLDARNSSVEEVQTDASFSELRYIFLSNNKLKHFDVKFLEGSYYINFLYLDGNQLEEIDYDLLTTVELLTTIHLRGNPMDCKYVSEMRDVLEKAGKLTDLKKYDCSSRVTPPEQTTKVYRKNISTASGIESRFDGNDTKTLLTTKTPPPEPDVPNSQFCLSKIWTIAGCILIAILGIYGIMSTIIVYKTRGSYTIRLDRDIVLSQRRSIYTTPN